jgi:hypothetical protein
MRARNSWSLWLPLTLLWFTGACGTAPQQPEVASASQPTGAPSPSIPGAEPIPSRQDRASTALPSGQENVASPQQTGAAHPATPVSATAEKELGPRVGAIGPHVWIMPKPRSKGLALGNLRLGTSVRLKSPDPIRGEGCGRGWLATEPRGYVCLGRRTTTDLDDPYYRALHEVAPQPGALFPYRYAHSRGAPMYSRVPTPAEWKDAEERFGPPGTYAELGEWAKGHEELIQKGRKIVATDPVPWFFEGGKRHVGGGTRDVNRLLWKVIPNGSMLAYAKAFEMHGRVWLVTADLTVVPADRVQFMRRSKFRGVELGDQVTLPLAWNRNLDPRPLYRQSETGEWSESGQTLAAKQWQMIAKQRSGSRADPYWELRNRPGLFVRGKHVTLTRARAKLPRAVKADERWVDAKINPGTLTVYEGITPIYATLFSPGIGGPSVPGLDHTKYATTQTGYFRFEWKERVATMSNEKGDPTVLWFSDVPHIQYVRAPLAMHVAYWHEDFSNRKSAECLNLSPHDGHRLFALTDPPLPEGWGAVRPGGGNGRSTAIIINGD